IVLDAAAVTTSGPQTYRCDVSLNKPTVTLSSTGTGALGDITLAQSVDGTSDLTVTTAGTTTFGGAVGNNTALNSLTTDITGTPVINGPSVTTSRTQTYNDDVTVGSSPVSLNSKGTDAAGDITFGKTVNGGSDLTVNTAGTTLFGGPVGN